MAVAEAMEVVEAVMVEAVEATVVATVVVEATVVAVAVVAATVVAVEAMAVDAERSRRTTWDSTVTCAPILVPRTSSSTRSISRWPESTSINMMISLWK